MTCDSERKCIPKLVSAKSNLVQVKRREVKKTSKRRQLGVKSFHSFVKAKLGPSSKIQLRREPEKMVAVTQRTRPVIRSEKNKERLHLQIGHASCRIFLSVLVQRKDMLQGFDVCITCHHKAVKMISGVSLCSLFTQRSAPVKK